MALTTRGALVARAAIGRYQLCVELARGPLGTLWIARAEGASSLVAVRYVQSRAAFGRAEREAVAEGARWARDLDHAALVPVIDVELAGDDLGVIQGYVEGEPLQALLRAAALAHAPLLVPVAVRLTLDVLDGLEYLRARRLTVPRGSVFGGLTPEQIIVGTDGRARILEPGIACLGGGQIEPGTAATPGLDALARDPKRACYHAPERFAGREIDARADVWTTAVLLWEMLRNKALWTGGTYQLVAQRVSTGTVSRADAGAPAGGGPTPAPLADVVARALALAPDERFATFAEMSAALRATGAATATSADVKACIEALCAESLAKQRAQAAQALGDSPISSARRGPAASAPVLTAAARGAGVASTSAGVSPRGAAAAGAARAGAGAGRERPANGTGVTGAVVAPGPAPAKPAARAAPPLGVAARPGAEGGGTDTSVDEGGSDGHAPLDAEADVDLVDLGDTDDTQAAGVVSHTRGALPPPVARRAPEHPAPPPRKLGQAPPRAPAKGLGAPPGSRAGAGAPGGAALAHVGGASGEAQHRALTPAEALRANPPGGAPTDASVGRGVRAARPAPPRRAGEAAPDVDAALATDLAPALADTSAVSEAPSATEPAAARHSHGGEDEFRAADSDEGRVSEPVLTPSALVEALRGGHEQEEFGALSASVAAELPGRAPRTRSDNRSSEAHYDSHAEHSASAPANAESASTTPPAGGAEPRAHGGAGGPATEAQSAASAPQDDPSAAVSPRGHDGAFANAPPAAPPPRFATPPGQPHPVVAAGASAGTGAALPLEPPPSSNIRSARSVAVEAQAPRHGRTAVLVLGSVAAVALGVVLVVPALVRGDGDDAASAPATQQTGAASPAPTSLNAPVTTSPSGAASTTRSDPSARASADASASAEASGSAPPRASMAPWQRPATAKGWQPPPQPPHTGKLPKYTPKGI